MSFTNCPDWICHQNGVPHDYVYGVTTFLIAIPYILLLIWGYKKWWVPSSRMRKYLLFLAALLGYLIYNYILFFAFLDSKNAILSFIGVISAGPIITFSLLLPFLVLGIIILLIIYFYKLRKKEKDQVE